MSPEPPSRTEQLVLLLTQNQEPLFRYIFSLVSSEADARDILQETSLALYRKFDQYENSRPFLPWAYRFAYLQIQKHRTKFARSPLLFSEDLIHLLALEREQMEPELKGGGSRMHLERSSTPSSMAKSRRNSTRSCKPRFLR